MNNIIKKISETIRTTTQIDPDLFQTYNVKRGLRNEDHTGVVVGLTKVGDVVGYERDEDGSLKAIPGKLIYRGINIEDIVKGAQEENRLGFEETIFLILAGYLPAKEELKDFSQLLSQTMDLNPKITMHILDLEGSDIMNILSRCVLELYTFDENADDTSEENLVRQSLNLIATFPTIIAYAYNALRHNQGKSLHIRHPKVNLSLAENFLYMMKGNKYTPLEVKILDLALMVHADHGGGNNSTFAVRVTSSTGTDTYSSIAAGIGSLKGPLHGGANLRVVDMLKHIKKNIKDWTDVEEVDAFLQKILNKQAYNKTGLIYGIGHAIYTISDPRATLLKEMARDLAIEKGREDEFNFYNLLEERAIKNFMEYKGSNVKKQVCANVDFYSGFVYDMIGLPQEIYTPLFAMARIVGWTAHRIEELNFKERRIIRPAYKNASDIKSYIPLNERT
ncbi:citrate synthase [Dysgonomonas alginatilytica]|uniref:Citrate synthase n=1 Tax=Dysgonomonas alginatilytica TaxID=1605892 RepID=A0A2V3PJK9_9BACT|nr:citrate synthase [Dysgonomonas alginatilytica]PXV58377.1 citrate synthase [Dysgonomonas alginatilytica]